MAATPAAPDRSATIAPIELDVVVPCDPGRAFDYFTRDIGRWWPLALYSCAEDNAASVVFEPRAGDAWSRPRATALCTRGAR